MRIPTAYLYFLVPCAVLAGLFLLWLLVGSLLSRVGGWNALSQVYPVVEGPGSEDLGRCSITLSRGPFAINYNGSVHIVLGAAGLGMEASSLFRRFHAPLTIPWSEVETCVRQKQLTGEATAVTERRLHREILIRGEAGVRVYDYWQRVQPSASH